MQRFLRWLQRINAFRIGLATGLLFALMHLITIGGRWDLPVLTRMENALTDLQFKQRVLLRAPGTAPHSGALVIAAIDEPSIARFGRFPWDRRVIATLIDKLDAAGAKAIGFDISYSDEDLGGQFAGAKRYRKRFEDVSLAAPQNRVTVDRFGEAEADIAGAVSALSTLKSKVRPDAEPIYQTARGRLEDGGKKLSDAKTLFASLVRQHEAYATELDAELGGEDPDTLLGAAVGRAADKVVLGIVMLTAPEMRDFNQAEIEEHLRRAQVSRISPPEFRDERTGLSTPVKGDTWVKRYAGFRAPLQQIAKGVKWVGYFNNLPDFDGVIRHTALTMRIDDQYFPSLDAALAAIALGLKPRDIIPVTLTPNDGQIDAIDFGGKRLVPVDTRGIMAINYVGGDQTFPNYSVAEIMEGKRDADLKDKVVLVGVTAQGTFDQRVTPLNRISSGVETHANAVDNILTGQFLRRGIYLELGEVVLALLLALVFAWSFARVRVTYALPLLGASALGVWVLSSVAFHNGWQVFAALPLIEMGAMFTLTTVYRYATEERDKRQLRKAFQLYLNPEVMEEMLDDPKALQLGGKELDLSVLFSDIRGFTTLAEQLSPQALVHLLNEYLSPMTDIVFEKRGTLDKYIGDAVMAFFGAPVQTDRHARNACDAALRMMEELHRLREKWRIEDPDMPDIDIGIGINSGPMVVGNMGSWQRFNYTVMGDNVNTASRLEGLNKEYGTHVLISEQTLISARKGAGDEGLYCVRELDYVAVKGRREPVRLFELRSGGPATTAERPLLDGYGEGLALYRAQRFSEARLQFESLLLRYPGDGPCLLFLRRCDEMSENPPGENWNGVYQMSHK